MPISFNPIDINQPEVNSFVDMFGDGAETELAKEIVSEFARNEFASKMQKILTILIIKL